MQRLLLGIDPAHPLSTVVWSSNPRHATSRCIRTQGQGLALVLGFVLPVGVGLAMGVPSRAPSAKVTVARVPENGIQPRVAVDDRGRLHMVYFAGDARHGNLFYVRSTDAGATFSAALRVNSRDG